METARDRRLVGAVALALALGAAAPAAGQEETLALLDDGEVQRRLDLATERLDASRDHGRAWQWGWLGVSGGGGIASAALAAHQNGDDQAGSIVNAATGAVGVGYLLWRPLEARHGADRIRAMPSDTLAQRRNQLLAAEAQLVRNAERAEERTSLEMHTGNVAFNLAAGAFVVGFGNLGDAGITAGSGILAGALQLWTLPARPKGDLESYRAATASTAAPRGTGWRLAPQPRGLALEFRF